MQEGITIPQIEKLSEDKNSASFLIQPLYPGYGVTIGNALRRILYSSLEGAAIFAVSIEGATHEFSIIPAIKEDVIQIILNLKQIRLKLHGSDEATLTLDIKGPKEIKAGNIKCPSSVEIVNPDHHIASVGKTGKLNMEIKVNKGLGYVVSETVEEGSYPLGTIILDAIYSPIKKVNYSVEPVRVGKMTNYDKLTVDITTDGTIEPSEALKNAAEILVDQFDLIKNLKSKTTKTKKESNKKITKTISADNVKNQKIEDAGFSTRTTNALINNKIKTVAGLARLSVDSIQKLKGLGGKGILEIEEKIKE